MRHVLSKPRLNKQAVNSGDHRDDGIEQAEMNKIIWLVSKDQVETTIFRDI